MDRYFLDPRAQQDTSPKTYSVFLTTCFLIASKYDEIDDKLVFISDVQGYYKTTQYAKVMPMWSEVVETERHIMKFFDWNIGFPLPVHFVEMFLAQGVLYENEVNDFDDDEA